MAQDEAERSMLAYQSFTEEHNAVLQPQVSKYDECA
jgi:hypothetical protein